MKLLEDKILSDGKALQGNILKVDGFLNHRIDIELLNEMGKEFYRLFSNYNINKILTVEASGIAVACIAAQYFNVPVVFAKKGQHKNVSSDCYKVEVFSFTKGTNYTMFVSKEYLSKEDNILIIDDFLANGQAVFGMKSLCEEAGACIKGVGIAIEKGFQDGGKKLREEGLNVQSLAIVESMTDEKIVFRSGD